MKYSVRSCGIVHFYSYVIGLPSNGTILGYIWDFGNGNMSYD